MPSTEHNRSGRSCFDEIFESWRDLCARSIRCLHLLQSLQPVRNLYFISSSFLRFLPSFSFFLTILPTPACHFYVEPMDASLMARMFQEPRTKDSPHPTQLLVSSTVLALLIMTAATTLIVVLAQSTPNWLCTKTFVSYISLSRRVKTLLR